MQEVVCFFPLCVKNMFQEYFYICLETEITYILRNLNINCKKKMFIFWLRM